MTVFWKTFLYTFFLLVSAAAISAMLLYFLLPYAYESFKLRALQNDVDQLVANMGESDQAEFIRLVSDFAAESMANVIFKYGDEHYGLLMWPDAGTSNSSLTIGISMMGPQPKELAVDAVSSEKIQSARSNEGNTFTGPNADSVSQFEHFLRSQKIVVSRQFEIKGSSGELIASVSYVPIREATNVILSLMPISVFLCLILSAVSAFLYARVIVGPIEHISKKVCLMSDLNSEVTCDVNSSDEIGLLASNINKLHRHLRDSIQSLAAEMEKTSEAERAKADFLRSASHELKTPVTAVSVILENMILEVGKYRDHKQWLPRCKQLINELSSMLSDVLTASRLEDTNEPPVTTSIDELCKPIIEPYLLVAKAKGVVVEIDWSGAFEVSAPRYLIGKAISNVFSNAVNYTRSGDSVRLHLRDRCLLIENQTEPIPDDEIRHLFQPFNRYEDSRCRESRGTGLGLYIATSILNKLELDYQFEPICEPFCGMRFSIKF